MKTWARTVLGGVSLVLGGVLVARPAAALERLVVTQDIAHDDNAPPDRQDDWLDSTFLFAWPQVYASATLGSFDAGLEAGGYLWDGRGSTYGITLRRRQGGYVENTSAEFGTQQKFARLLLTASTKLFWPDHPEGDNLSVVPAAGVEVYYRSDCFASLRVSYDPRPDTGTTFRFANRLGTQRRHFDLAIAPRTDGVVNYAAYGRWDYFLLGFGQEHDYDFTRIDRRSFFFGFQYDFGS